MTKKLSNLEKIKAAWSMGWVAVITQFIGEEFERQFVVSDALIYPDKQNQDHYKNGVYLRAENGKSDWFGVEEINLPKFEITSFLYAGQLAGNEPIPIGMKFRVKESGQIGKFILDTGRGVELEFEKNHGANLSYEEIEPVFD